MAYVSGKTEHLASSKLVRLAGHKNGHRALEAGEELASAGQMGRSTHRCAGRKVHQLHDFVRHRLRNQGPRRDAAAAIARGQVRGAPLSHFRPGRRQELIDRRTERARYFDEHPERRVALSRFEVRDRRARDTGGLRKRLLRHSADMPEAKQVAREMRGGLGRIVHFLNLCPTKWTCYYRACVATPYSPAVKESTYEHSA